MTTELCKQWISDSSGKVPLHDCPGVAELARIEGMQPFQAWDIHKRMA
jgi:hypothetical protein